ncbi:universal stress protein [Halanaerobacter jeridensis]|uniref:Nucleotide-binding universal stress UspA family protein n=1 Tax=Halanaerobacter jeridensis TaxID=706427 RepID=A0A938XTY8_9FIRM|nr:nucleotide-binding universal stress UspA family protein [Halanaerobacter jeridensis]
MKKRKVIFIFKQGKVLLSTDFSKRAEKLTDTLVELKNVGMEEVVILQVLNVDFNIPQAVDYSKKADKKLLERSREKAEEMGLEATVEVKVGETEQQIVKTAEEENCDLILMGSHGGGTIKNILLGSTTHNVIRKTKIPVLIEKYEEIQGGDLTAVSNKKFDDILLPIDFSDSTNQILDIVEKMNVPSEKITLISIIERSDSLEELKEKKEKVKSKLEQVQAKLVAQDIDIKYEIEVRHGEPADNIVEIAEEKENNLIIMPTRGQGSIKELLIGSTAEQVAKKSPIPVLLVPDNRK